FLTGIRGEYGIVVAIGAILGANFFFIERGRPPGDRDWLRLDHWRRRRERLRRQIEDRRQVERSGRRDRWRWNDRHIRRRNWHHRRRLERRRLRAGAIQARAHAVGECLWIAQIEI